MPSEVSYWPNMGNPKSVYIHTCRVHMYSNDNYYTVECPVIDVHIWYNYMLSVIKSGLLEKQISVTHYMYIPHGHF